MAAAHPDLDSIQKGTLVDASGLPFKEFRKTLTPRFVKVWLDIGMGWLSLSGSLVLLALADRWAPRWWPITGALGALLVGYIVAYLQLFFHEAAHYNLAKSRKQNDVLANLFIGLMIGQDVSTYRLVHFDHHRGLGTPEDTERSYFEALRLGFIVEALTGIRVVRVLLHRRKHVSGKAERAPRGFPVWLLLGALFNLTLLGAALITGSYALALGWVAGVFLVHPCCNSVRQVLEHRSLEASSSTDYSQVPHGAVTRMFGDGILASTLGGAGFNRHLLHHWEPQVSYTRFRDLEAYLLRTEAGEVLRRHTTTYTATFWALLRSTR